MFDGAREPTESPYIENRPSPNVVSTAISLRLRPRQRAIHTGVRWQDSVAIDGQPLAWVSPQQAWMQLRFFERSRVAYSSLGRQA
jgi:hypothetical protein